jgi:hypothetical protein
MVKRYFELKDFIKSIADEDEYLDDLVHLLQKDKNQLTSLMEKLELLNSVNLKLQENNITLLTVRKLFDHVLKSFPSMISYLARFVSVYPLLSFF